MIGASGNRAAASVRPNVRNMIIRRPRGVIVAIIPWNFPAMTPMRKLVPTMRVACEEIFRPVLSVLAYRDIDECETGMMHVNHGTIPDSHMPFGGIKPCRLAAIEGGGGRPRLCGSRRE